MIMTKSPAKMDEPIVQVQDIGIPAKVDSVRSVFENVPHYLKSRQVDIMMRQDAVRQFGCGVKRSTLLDIGCGDGSITLPLWMPGSRLTLLDLSKNMLARAAANLPRGSANQVELRHESFADAAFAPFSFDLIVTVGVMAHVESPDAFLQKIKSILRPGGHVILEFTDACHFVGRIDRFFGWIKERIAPSKYATNRLSEEQVQLLLRRHRFLLLKEFRYARIPVPGVHRFVSASLLCRIVRAIFGTSNKNRNAWMGNEHICFLQSEA